MTTIDEIMVAVYAYSAATASGGSVCPRLAVAELRSLITQAIAEAREAGAREMREFAAQESRWGGDSGCDADAMTAYIRALPLPVGTVNVVMDREHGGLTFAPAKREPVRLTDMEREAIIFAVAKEFLGGAGLEVDSWDTELVRAVETAVLAANGLTK